MNAKDPHKHAYQTIKLIPCVAQDKAMGILARVCACGTQEAFEYGTRKDMETLKAKLEGRNGNTAESSTKRQTGADQEDIATVQEKADGEQLRA